MGHLYQVIRNGIAGSAICALAPQDPGRAGRGIQTDVMSRV